MPPHHSTAPCGVRRYLGLNSLLNLLNRWALGLHGLRFPLIMTASHMIFGSCALSPLMFLSPKYADKHTEVIQNDWKGLVAIAVMNGFQIACNNASLTVMELSMNQVRTPQLVACGPDLHSKNPAQRPRRDTRAATHAPRHTHRDTRAATHAP